MIVNRPIIIKSEISFSTVTEAAGSTLNAAYTIIHVGGFAALGDGGAAWYKRVVAEPSHDGKFQSADGIGWWELADMIVMPEMFGASDDAAIADAIECVTDGRALGALLRSGIIQGRSYQAVATDEDFTLTPGTSPSHTRHTGTLTADRTISLATTNAYSGQTFRVTRAGSGTYDLIVDCNPQVFLATGSWCDSTFDGFEWYPSAYAVLQFGEQPPIDEVMGPDPDYTDPADLLLGYTDGFVYDPSFADETRRVVVRENNVDTYYTEAEFWTTSGSDFIVEATDLPWAITTEGTFITHMERASTTSGDNLTYIRNADNTERMSVFNHTSDRLRFRVTNGGVTSSQPFHEETIAAGITFAAGFSYKAARYNCAVNGVYHTAITSFTIPAVTRIMLVGATTSGRFKHVIYIPKWVEDEELGRLSNFRDEQDYLHAAWGAPNTLVDLGSGQYVMTGVDGRDGSILCATYDATTAKFKRSVVGSRVQDDIHSHASLARKANGQYMTLYSYHNGAEQWAALSKSTSGLVWNDRSDKDAYLGLTEYTYNQLFQLSDGRILTLFRASVTADGSAQQATHYSISEDFGRTFSPAQQITWNEPNRPYSFYAQHPSIPNRIDFSTSQGHPEVGDLNIYHFYGLFNDDAVTFHKSDGTLITTPMTTSSPTIVHDSSGATKGANHVSFISHDASENPTILYMTMDAANTGFKAYQARSTSGGVWTTTYVCDTGGGIGTDEDYAWGGMCATPANPDVIYVAREVDGAEVIDPVAGIFQIYKAETALGDWSDTVLTKLTSVADTAIKPVIASGGGHLFYLTGTYSTFASFDTTVAVIDLVP